MSLLPHTLHDPLTWLLNHRVGWRAAALRGATLAAGGSLTLPVLPESGRSLTESNGGFGGLVLPSNVAVSEGGTVYLLDRETQQLKRFDACECRFTPLPSTGGEGSRPRQFSHAGSIGIHRGNLYLVDTGNRRVQVFALLGFMLRAIWTAPALPKLTPWEPLHVAFDANGYIYITDPANGCIHRFTPSGRHRVFASGLGTVRHIAVDRHGSVYVTADLPEPHTLMLDADGMLLGALTREIRSVHGDLRDEAWRPIELASDFPEAAIVTDEHGNLSLGDRCAQTGDCQSAARRDASGDVWFTDRGLPLPQPPSPRCDEYATLGYYYSEALDSRIYDCQWHRVMLRGHIPAGTSVEVTTFTAAVMLPAQDIVNLPDDAWQTRQIAYPMDDGEWDCLIRSDGGRYLWLRLALRGDGGASPRIDSAAVEYPRISLRRYLPAVFGEDPISADFTDRFLSIFDTTLRSIEHHVDTQAHYFNAWSAPAASKRGEIDFLTWLASWLGLVMDRNWPESLRRKFLAQAGQQYLKRGTLHGLRDQLLVYLGMQPDQVCCPDHEAPTTCHPRVDPCTPPRHVPCTWTPPRLILEHFRLRRWLFVGSGRLGDAAMLWGQDIVNRSQLDSHAQVRRSQLITTPDPHRDPFLVYAHQFSVFVPARCGRSARQRRTLENLIRAEMPAHTKVNIQYVEPRFRVGVQASIGLNSVIGRYPDSTTLNEVALGAASVLSSSGDEAGRHAIKVGSRSRIGATTRLE